MADKDNPYYYETVQPSAWLEKTANVLNILAMTGSLASTAMEGTNNILKKQNAAILNSNKEDVYRLDSYFDSEYKNNSDLSMYDTEKVSAATGVDAKVVNAFMKSRAFKKNDVEDGVTWQERQLRANKIDAEYNYTNISAANKKIANMAVLATGAEQATAMDAAAENMSKEDVHQAFRTKDFSKIANAAGITDENLIKSWGASRDYPDEAFNSNAQFVQYNIQAKNITENPETGEAEEGLGDVPESVYDTAFRLNYASEFSKIGQYLERKNNEANVKRSSGEMSDEEWEKLQTALNDPETLAKDAGVTKMVAENFLKQAPKYAKEYSDAGISYSNVGLANGFYTKDTTPEKQIEAYKSSWMGYLSDTANLYLNGDEEAGVEGIIDSIKKQRGVSPDKLGELLEAELDKLFSPDGELCTQMRAMNVPEEYLEEWIRTNKDTISNVARSKTAKTAEQAIMAQTKTFVDAEWENISKPRAGEITSTETLQKALNTALNAINSGAYSRVDAHSKSLDAIKGSTLSDIKQLYDAYPNMSLDALVEEYGKQYDAYSTAYLNAIHENSSDAENSIYLDKKVQNMNDSDARNALGTYMAAHDEEMKKAATRTAGNLKRNITKMQKEGEFYSDEEIFKSFGNYSSMDDIPTQIRDVVSEVKFQNSIVRLNSTFGNGSFREAITNWRRNDRIRNIDTATGNGLSYVARGGYVTLSNSEISMSDFYEQINRTKEETELVRDAVMNSPTMTDAEKEEFMSEIDAQNEDEYRAFFNTVFKNSTFTNEYVAGTEPKDGQGVWVEDIDSFMNMVKTFGITDNTMILNLALETAAIDKGYSQLSYKDKLISEFDPANLEEWSDNVEFARAAGYIDPDEYDLLSKWATGTPVQQACFKNLKDYMLGKIDEALGKDKRNSTDAEWYKENMLAKLDNELPKILDMANKNPTGWLTQSQIDEIFGPIDSEFFTKGFLKDVYNRSKSWNLWNGYMPTITKRSKDIDVTTMQYAQQLTWEALNGNALWYIGDNTNYLQEAVMGIINNPSNANALQNRKGFHPLSPEENYLLEFTSQYIDGQKYDDIEEDMQSVVVANSLVVGYIANSYVDTCRAAGKVFATYDADLESPTVLFSDNIVSAVIDGCSLGIVDINSGEVWWYSDETQTTLNHKKFSKVDMNNGALSNGFGSIIRIDSSALRKVESGR